MTANKVVKCQCRKPEVWKEKAVNRNQGNR